MLVYLDGLFYLIVISAWVGTADKVANETSEEQLNTHKHSHKEDKEPSRVCQWTVDVIAELYALLNTHHNESDETDEEHDAT